MTAVDIFRHLPRFAEGLACICGLATWQKWRGTPWRMFTGYLLFIVLAEAAGAYTIARGMFQANTVLYQYLVIPAEFLVAFFLFRATADSRRGRELPAVAAGLYLIALAVNTIFLSRLNYNWKSASYTIGNVLMLILALRAMMQLATSPQILFFWHRMMFWACMGWLLFYLGTLPFYGLHDALYYHYPHLFHTYRMLAKALDTGMYLLFAAGFLCSRPG